MGGCVATIGLAFLGLEWARPAGLWALVLPLLLLLASRLRTRPTARPTGTLPLWRKVVGEVTPRGRTSRSLPPLAVWLTAAALVAGAVALAGPRGAAPPAPVVWTVVVDHDPSLSLPWVGADGRPDEEGRTRLARALAQAFAVLDEQVSPADRVRWISSAREPLELAAGERPPPAWTAAPRGHAPSPAWVRHDDEGTLWVTDLVPSPEPERAGLVAVGGAPIEGPVGGSGADRLDWVGGSLVEVPGGLGERSVTIVPGGAGREVPRRIAEVFRHWAEARGFVVLAPSRPTEVEDALALAPAPGDGPLRAVTAGRDGWLLQGTAVEDPAAGSVPFVGSRTWLAYETAEGITVPLVRTVAGRVEVAWRTLAGPPVGDPAAFAVSWARLFDESTLPPPGVVPLAERRTTGPPVTRTPSPPPRREAVRVAAAARADRIDAWLAAAGALLALAALSAGLLRRG